jgi:hypothetical protein
MDIVSRLLAIKNPYGPGPHTDCREAAVEITRLRKERDEYKASATSAMRDKRRLWNLAQGYPADCDNEGPRCRDCADFDGRCQGTGAPCDPQEAAEERIVNLRKERDEARAECGVYVVWRSSLRNPNVVHLNMLTGEIAKPSVEQIRHIYQDKLNAALPTPEATK